MDTTSKGISRLHSQEMDRLKTVLREDFEIHGSGNFPTIKVRLVNLIASVRRQLREQGIKPSAVKLNGGAASYVVAARDFVYSDLDLIFFIRLDIDGNFEKVRNALYNTLLGLMPSSTDTSKISHEVVKDIYMKKMVKVNNSGDRWSLFSLHNDYGRCIELKFVDTMKRQFEFSVDSFQVHLDTILDKMDGTGKGRPVVLVESVYGDINMARKHLDERLIATHQPEEIRGGGLLKYCHLLMRGFKLASNQDTCKMEKYMCSRFFIDFPDLATQEAKLRSYLDNHFGNFDSWSCNEDSSSEASSSQTPSFTSVSQAKYDFLMLLHRVISESTVCLMSHDRRCTLQLIDQLAYQFSIEPLELSLSALSTNYGLPSPGSNYGYFQQSKPMLLYMPANTSQWIPVV